MQPLRISSCNALPYDVHNELDVVLKPRAGHPQQALHRNTPGQICNGKSCLLNIKGSHFTTLDALTKHALENLGLLGVQISDQGEARRMRRQLAQLGVIDSEKVTILFEEDDLGAGKQPQCFQTAPGAVSPLLEFVDERPDTEAQRFKIKVVLRLVVEINGTFGDFRHLRNLFDGSIVKALLAKDGAGGVQKLAFTELG